jgi:glycosyltransferase involved in cell wall biosynthesis
MVEESTAENSRIPVEEQLKHSMKILHIFGRMTRGGAEMRTLDLMRHIDQDQYKFHFCALSGLPGELDEEVRGLGGEVFYIKLGRSFPSNFRRFLRSGNYQVVHSHVHYFSGYVLRLAAQAGVPGRIAHFRNMDDGKDLTLLRKIRNRIMKGWINRYATDIVAVCEGAMRSAWGEQWHADPRCQVIYNGLDLSKFNGPLQPDRVRREFGLPDNCKLIIHIGRMVPQKNHERVISIFNEIASRHSNVCLLLVGRRENGVENRLRDMIARFDLVEKVAFAGERNDVPRLLRSSDMMVFPSLWEGLPGAVLESCAVGTPILASDLPGVREIAAQFPCFVKAVPLNTGDSEWSLLAEEILESKEPAGSVENNFNHFQQSIFNIDKCVEEFCKVWARRM